MIGTSFRGPVRGARCCALPGSAHKQGLRGPFINVHPTLQCHHPAVLYTTAGREVV
ncbi:unnamed protein product, partial [Staurois parvus]